ncbi:MAG: hypothetical protein KDJ70_05295 [Candidatus Competibacteraceae bacterium]|nr:hypothetical protein [Candidatus Competibacteraceae bacterium]
MRFNAAVTTLMFAGVLAATPQLAAAAGCLGYNDVKTTHAEAAENGGNTEITLDGSCYNLVSIVYLGQQNGTMVKVPAGNVQNNGSNQIIVTTNGLLAPGDYRIELWYNTFGGGAPTANGSAFLTVAAAAAPAGGGAPELFIARGDEVKGKQSENPFWFSPSGQDKSVKDSDAQKVGMRMPVDCEASGLSAWAENTNGLTSGESILVRLLANNVEALSCTITIGTTNPCTATGPFTIQAGNRIVFEATMTANSDGDKADVVTSWSCAPTPPAP